MKTIKQEQTIYILEISFCGDLRYEEHFRHKQEQHTQLKEALIAEGWQNVKLLDPLLFGVGGSLYTSTRDIIHTQLQIPIHNILDAFRKIQVKAAMKAADIVRSRREHDRPMRLGPLPPTLKRGKDYKG